MSREEQLRREIVEYSHRVYAKGWVANHDGNLSVRLSEALTLCTPTAISKGDVSPELLIVVDAENKVVQGTRHSFSELALHRACHRARPDIACVIHAHPPTATGFCVANKSLGEHFMPEPVVSLGAKIPLVSFFSPKSKDLEREIEKALQDADVIMMANHGVLAVGDSFEQAFLRLELVEHLAKIALVAIQLGGAVPIPSSLVAQLAGKGRPTSLPLFSESGSSGNPNKAQEKAGKADSRPDLQSLIASSQRKFS